MAWFEAWEGRGCCEGGGKVLQSTKRLVSGQCSKDASGPRPVITLNGSSLGRVFWCPKATSHCQTAHALTAPAALFARLPAAHRLSLEVGSHAKGENVLVSERIWDPAGSVGERTRSEQLQEDIKQESPHIRCRGSLVLLWECGRKCRGWGNTMSRRALMPARW